jgi:glycosyltransferase involved in cell wall biosynthesis
VLKNISQFIIAYQVKILQILNPVTPLPAKTVGGSERIVEYLMDELINLGHEVAFMGHDESSLNKKIIHIPIGTYLDRQKTLKTAWKHLITNKYDVVHNHGRLFYFAPIIYSKTRKLHTFHMADLDNNGFHNFLRMKPRNLTFSPCGKWIQDKYQSLGGNWQYVNNGLPIAKYSFDDKPIDNESPLIIICRIGPGKGLLDAIAIAKQANKKLVIAGKIGDYPHEIEWFNENIAKHVDGNSIKFIGIVNDEEKNALLNQALALIIPTKDSEAFNTTMIEANACGCPVISYNRFCFPEYIENGVNGYIGDTKEDLIDAVRKVNLLDRQVCRAYFELKYTSRTMALNYQSLYATPLH